LRGKKAISEPFKMLWLAANTGLGGAQGKLFQGYDSSFQAIQRAKQKRIAQKKTERAG
jgi:hypothetical protein